MDELIIFLVRMLAQAITGQPPARTQAEEMKKIRQRMAAAKQNANSDSDVMMARMPPPIRSSPAPRNSAPPTLRKATPPQRRVPPPLPASKPVAPLPSTKPAPPAPVVAAVPQLRNSAPLVTSRDVIKLLNPSSIRMQIILNEVLQPPLSLRD